MKIVTGLGPTQCPRASFGFDKLDGLLLGHRLAAWRQITWRAEARQAVHWSIESQGDGMRSFAGVLLHSSIMDRSVLLVDEPEAFLHPPQARHLGKMIATEAKSERQFFIATHSGDFLRGLLESAQQNIRVIRLERKGAINAVKELKNEDIRELWSDSLLRYSNVLDGMFHEMVILCEGDSDCRFFAAILDTIFDAKPDEKRPDLMFTHCGGKDRIKVGAKALKAIGVKVAVIADLDALNGKSLDLIERFHTTALHG